jgi:hypothetical protein
LFIAGIIYLAFIKEPEKPEKPENKKKYSVRKKSGRFRW